LDYWIIGLLELATDALSVRNIMFQ
jgi:hypothetical protein